MDFSSNAKEKYKCKNLICKLDIHRLVSEGECKLYFTFINFNANILT